MNSDELFNWVWGGGIRYSSRVINARSRRISTNNSFGNITETMRIFERRV